MFYFGLVPFLIFTSSHCPACWPEAFGIESHGVMVKMYSVKWDTLSRTCYVISSLRWFYVSRLCFHWGFNMPSAVVIGLEWAIGVILSYVIYGILK